MGGRADVPCGTGEPTGCTPTGLVGGRVDVPCDDGELTGGIFTKEGEKCPCGNGEPTAASPEECSLTLIMFSSILNPSSCFSACSASLGLAKLT